MCLAYRASRPSLFAGKRSQTPAPGAYEVGGRPRSVPPAYVGFATSAKRASLALRDASKTPAPGEGQVLKNYSMFNKNKTSTGVHGSNNFRSQAPRFAPSFPGSSVYRPSSVRDNPGPGAYNVRSRSSSGEAHSQSESTASAAVANYDNAGAGQILTTGARAGGDGAAAASTIAARKRSLGAATGQTRSKGALVAQEMMRKQSRYTPVPTIPSRSQSHGYDTLPRGKLVAQLPPPELYSGIGQDTVGPAMYNVRANSVAGNVPKVNFSRTSKRGDTFKLDRAATSKIGPGQYDLTVGGKRPDIARPSPAFASKVKMAHEVDSSGDGSGALVGPGSYEATSSIRSQQAPLSSIDGLAAKVQRFGTTAQREGGWDRDPAAPFTNKRNDDHPGPGAYGEKRTSFHVKLQKKLTEEVVGFNSTQTRPCLTEDSDAQMSVGPGQYDDPKVLAQSVKRRAIVGRNGVFGTTEERFRNGVFADPNSKEIKPGPGAYNVTSDTKNKVSDLFPSDRPESTAAFRSESRRFGGPMKNSRKQAIEEEHRELTQASTRKSLRSASASGKRAVATTEFKWGQKPKKYPESRYGYGRNRGKGRGFTSSAGRFGTKGERAGLFGVDSGGPGPAGYGAGKRSVSSVRRRQQSRRGHVQSGALRFGSSRRAASAASLGPGRYNVSGSMVKKTFNITYSV